MKEKVLTIKQERQKRFLLVLPVLVLPFAIFVFWILGLVGPGDVQAQTHSAGLNTSLPSAIPPKDSSWTKMNFYEQADLDSMKIRQAMKQDPLYKTHTIDEVLHASVAKASYQPYPDSALNQADEEERKVNEKLALIHRRIEAPASKPHPGHSNNVSLATIPGPEVDRLETMMHAMKSKNEPDSELIQMNQLIEKILAVQHPELVQAKLKEQQKELKKFTVETAATAVNVSTRLETNRFYSLNDNQQEAAATGGIAAVVQDNQTISDGAVLKMRLMQAVFINGIEIAENSFVYGVAHLQGNRMLVTVSGVPTANNILPVRLSVFAGDGMEGIPLQGIGAKAELQTAVDQSTQGINISSIGMGVGAEVAGAAMQAGKSLLKKHIRGVQIQVPAGYEVLLQNVH